MPACCVFVKAARNCSPRRDEAEGVGEGVPRILLGTDHVRRSPVGVEVGWLPVEEGEQLLASLTRLQGLPAEDPAAADALRRGLSEVQGKLLIGVINSIGARRDVQSVPELGQLLVSPDPQIVSAAAEENPPKTVSKTEVPSTEIFIAAESINRGR